MARGSRSVARRILTRHPPDPLLKTRLWSALALAVLAMIVGMVFGWRWVFAPLLGWTVYAWATSSLRAMVHDGRAVAAAEDAGPTPVLGDERVLYWCEECGTEVLLVHR